VIRGSAGTSATLDDVALTRAAGRAGGRSLAERLMLRFVPSLSLAARSYAPALKAVIEAGRWLQ
jgi:hypothetical protein